MIENAQRKVWVMASPEVLEEIRTGWSRPVQVHADPNPDGSWEMTFRVFSDKADREYEKCKTRFGGC